MAHPDRETRTTRGRRAVNGVLLLDKPVGVSSNQALQRVKSIYRALKAGHTGSLDPLASGMLPICLGEATKISAYLLDADKVYRFRILLGARTATGDAEGAVVETGTVHLSEQALSRAIEQFTGEIQQIPPMHSALKHEGQRLYALARAGREVERSPRSVCIHKLEIEIYDPGRPVLRVHCSKGTYVRSLAEDIARAAGTVGHVIELRRLSVAPFPESGMWTMDGLESTALQGDAALDALLLPAESALEHLPLIELSPADAARIRHGQRVLVGHYPHEPAGIVRLYGARRGFLGVGERLADGEIVPRRLMNEPHGAAAGL